MAMRIFNADETIFTSNGLKSLQPIYCHEIRNESEWYLDVRVPLSFSEYTIQDNIIVVETLDKGEQAFRIRNITVGQDIKFEAWHIGYDSRVFTVELSTFVNLNPTQALTQLLTDTQTNNFTVFSNIATKLTFSIIDVPLYDALIDMAERYNAVLEFDNWQIRLVSSIGSDKGVTVAYGKNLDSSSFEENWDMVVTELYPKGNNGLVGTTLYSSIVYDRPYAKIVSFDTDDLTTLNNLASAYLSRFEKPRVNYKVKSDVILASLGDTIKVAAKQFELFTDVLSYKFNVITRKMIELEFGNYRPTIRNAIGQLRAEVVEQSRNITQLKIDEVNGEISTLVTDVGGLDNRLDSAETSITQQAGQIALKADQTTVNAVSAVANSKAKTFLSTPTTPYYVGDIWIETNATTGGNRVCTTQRLTGAYVAGDWTKEGVTSRMDSAELRITPAAITSTVRSSTEYTNDLGGKENTVFKQNTAPAHVNGRLWLDTSVTPNVLNRSNGTAWVRATPTQASEVGAYSRGQVDTLLTSYSTITQTANNITLAVETAVGGQDSILPYTQATWEVGAITGDGSLVADSTYIRTNNFFTILPSTDYVLQCSGTLDFSNTIIYFFNSSNAVVGLSGFTGGDLKITTPSTAVKFRVRARKQGGGVFPLSEMPNHWVRVVPVGKFLKGSKFEINGEKIISQADGIEFQNASGTPVVFFDTVNNRFVFRGQVEANTGLIGRFAISGQDLVYTSELFDYPYDRSDEIKLRRILLGVEPQTPYDLWVYDVDNSGTLDITDLVLIVSFIESGTPLPTPRKRIRSVVRIGTNNGALITQAVAENGAVGPTTTIRGEKITGDLINTNALSTKTMSLNGNTISGGIEASGSNADGHWIRYSDGTQICWNDSVSTYNNSAGTGVINLPASFIDTSYSVTVNARGLASGSLNGSFVAEYRLENTSSFIIKLLVHNPTTIVAAANGTRASYQAIGRWK